MRLVAGLESTQLRAVYLKISQAMQQANLEIVDKNYVETMEVHIKDPSYRKYAFASIRCDAGKYVELRFPRRHLQALGIVDDFNKLGGNVWRNDTSNYVRFQFYQLTHNEEGFINKISSYLKKVFAEQLVS